MTGTTPSSLARAGYLDAKQAAVRAERARTAPTGAALEALRCAATAVPAAPSFRDALTAGDTIALIAEFKRRSPSGGRMSAARHAVSVASGEGADAAPSSRHADAAAAAELYLRCGARAVSVLTDGADFDGSLDDLAAAARTAVPLLRKDFIVDAAGLYEARVAGAAATLLIVGILTSRELTGLLAVARDVRLDCLVEVHDDHELERALDAGAAIVGINNRDLRSLTTDLSTTERLAAQVPVGVTLVSESGIRSAADVARVRDAGAHAVLVGEALLRLPAAERCGAVHDLANVPRNAGPESGR